MGRAKILPKGMWKRGNTYYARFGANGRSVRKRLSTDFATACVLLNELRSRADRADFNLVDNDYPWGDLKAEYLRFKRQTSDNPDGCQSDLEQFEKYCKIRSVRQITHQYVFGFRDKRLADPVCPRTVNKQVGVLSHMLNMAVEWGRIGSNPIKGIKPLPHDKPTKVRRALSAPECEAILAHSPTYLLPIWRMFATTAIRRNELVTLLFSDIDWQNRTITIRAENSKNHEAREIPLEDEMLAMLARLCAEARHRKPVVGKTPTMTSQQAANFSAEHVFVTQANTPFRNNLLKRFYAVCQRAGIADAKPNGAVDIHALRGTVISLMIDGGANPKAVQKIVGHKTLEMTMNIYAKATDGGKRAAVAALPFAKVSAPGHIIPVQTAHKLSTTSSDETQPQALSVVA